MSTSLAIMELTEEIKTALYDKKVTLGVFIDLLIIDITPMYYLMNYVY